MERTKKPQPKSRAHLPIRQRMIVMDKADARWMCNTLFKVLWGDEEPTDVFSYSGGPNEDPKTRIRRIKSLNHL